MLRVSGLRFWVEGLGLLPCKACAYSLPQVDRLWGMAIFLRHGAISYSNFFKGTIVLVG